MKKISLFYYLLVFLFLPIASNAQSKGALKSTEYMSIKSGLEEIVIKRYENDLSTKINKDQFNLGINFELLKKKKNKENTLKGPLYNDLELGYLNPEDLFKSYSAQFESDKHEYLIKEIDVLVGLDPNLTAEAKKEVETWIAAKIKKDFGAIGKYEVNYLKNLEKVEVKNQTFMEKFKDFQLIGGSLVLALTLFLCSLLYLIFAGARGSSQESGTAESSTSVNIDSHAEISGAGTDEGSDSVVKSENSIVQINQLRDQIRDISEKLNDELEEVINEWCSQGEEGLYKLASFSEIASTVVGTVFIPEQYKPQVAALFSKMHKLSSEENEAMLQKIYWDLVASLNFGSGTLHEPFSFIADASAETLNKVLLKDDVKNQTVLTMFMPLKSRQSYLNELDFKQKQEVLKNAAHLSSISEDDLKGLEDQYASYFDEKIEESEVAMSMTLVKLIEALSLKEACLLLPSIDGPVIDQYKSKNPYIAFLPEWSDDSLKFLVKRLTNEEMYAYLKVMPDMTSRLLGFASPKTQEIVQDDLSHGEELTDQQTQEWLTSLNNKLIDLFTKGDLHLSDTIKSNGQNDIKIAA